MIHLFRSHYSLSSILTLDKAEEIKPDRPVSICSIAKQHKLERVVLFERRMSGLIEAYKNMPCQFIFGLILKCCESIEDKSEESEKTEHKIVVAVKSTKGYYDLLKIHNHAMTTGGRTDLKSIKSFWTKDLALCIPFYDSFLHNNSLAFANCFVDFSGLEPTFMIESHGLAFDHILGGFVKDYCKKNKFKIEAANSVFYYRPEDFTAYMTYRCITQQRMGRKRTLAAPELPFCSSDTFCYLRD